MVDIATYLASKFGNLAKFMTSVAYEATGFKAEAVETLVHSLSR